MADLPLKLDDLIEHVIAQHPNGDPLHLLGHAVQESTQLGELADHLVGHFVDQARQAGASWTEIGSNMGVTKQAAQKRFVSVRHLADPEHPDFPDRGPLTRFTPRARNVVAMAKTQAVALGHDTVTNIHLLLGLLTEPDGLAAQAIAARTGRSLDEVRDAVLATQHKRTRKARGTVRFSGESKKTLELALRQSLRMGHNYIGTEHLLLGILQQNKEPATELLRGLKVGYKDTCNWLERELEKIGIARQAAARRATR